MKKIIHEIRQFVEEECKKPTSKYGYEPFTDHFVPVVKHVRQMAELFKADSEVLEIAAWLHDIGSIVEGRKDHHITGSKIAEKKLLELGYPKEKIKLIKDCIITHRGSQKIKPKSLEAQILIEADTMSAFDNITGLFQCAYTYEKLSRNEARISVKEKLENKWRQLKFKKSKEIIRPKYKAAILLLK
jgi:uncharacterized protein